MDKGKLLRAPKGTLPRSVQPRTALNFGIGKGGLLKHISLGHIRYCPRSAVINHDACGGWRHPLTGNRCGCPLRHWRPVFSLQNGQRSCALGAKPNHHRQAHFGIEGCPQKEFGEYRELFSGATKGTRWTSSEGNFKRRVRPYLWLDGSSRPVTRATLCNRVRSGLKRR